MFTLYFGNSVLKKIEFDNFDNAYLKASELKNEYDYVCIKDICENIMIEYLSIN